MQFNKLHKTMGGKYEKSVFLLWHIRRIKIAVLCNVTKFRNSCFILRRDERRVRKERNAAGTPRCSGRSEQPIREMRK